MGKSLVLAIFVLLMVATVVTVDVLFFRHQFLKRLIANVAIVLVFIALYALFLNRA